MLSYPYKIRVLDVPTLNAILAQQKAMGGSWRRPTKQQVAGLPADVRLPIGITMLLESAQLRDGAFVRCSVGYDQVGHTFWLDVPMKLWKKIPEVTVESPGFVSE